MSQRGYPGPVRELTEGEVVHAIIERRARQAPDAVAVECGSRRLTYAQLDAQADRLAWRLREQGVSVDSTVVVFAEPSLTVLVAAVAVMKAGAAYVPVDPEYPAQRAALLLADSGAAAVVTGPGQRQRLPATTAPVLVWEGPGEAAAEPVGPPPGPNGGCVTVSGAHAACVVYTSGSTAQPRGVVITHRGLTNLALVAAERFALRPGDRFLQLASVSFSAFLEEVFPSLLCGATVVLAGYRRALTSVPALLRVLREQRITGFGITTAHWHELVDEMAASDTPFPPQLRFVLMGSERARPEQVAQWSRFGVPLIHVYGPTEATATVTYLHTGETDLARYQDWRLPIGTTVANTSVRLLDAGLRPVPEGTAGELYVGGVPLARGYHRSPGLTAAWFVPDPYGPPGSRLYRTGDLVRCLPDGNLEFLGRLDGQQKLRGHRIQPAEIETALETHPSVRRAVVRVREDRPGVRRLVAYLVGQPGVGQPGQEVSSGRLRKHLAQRLPEYLLPAAYLVLESLPLTPNGKLDTAALPPPEAGRPALDHPYEPPRGSTEQRLAELWSEVLGIGPVGATDGFIELGGDSLLATRVLARVHIKLRVDVPAIDVLRGTVRHLAELVDRLAGSAPRDTDELNRVRRKGELISHALRRAGAPPGPSLLSVSQQGLWVLYQLNPDSPLYNVPLRLRLSGPLDVAALSGALDTVVGRHEALRASFTTVDGKPVQSPQPAGPAALRTIDLRRHSAAEQVAEADRLVSQEATAPFDLATGPVFRSVLLHLDDEEFELVCNAHHLVFDGQSARVLLDEIAAAYSALRTGAEPSLPALPARYADFAVWQRDRLQGAKLDAMLRYWRERLPAVPEPLDLTGRPRPDLPGIAGANLRLPLPPGLKDRLAAVGRAERATLFMTLLTGFYAMLYQHSGQTDLCVGSPVANRVRPELASVIGFFVNTVVLRADLSGQDDTLRGLLRQVRATCLDAYEHQELPFDLLVERLNPPRRAGENPYFQVNFSVDEAPGLRVSLPDLVVHQGREVPTGTAKFDLTWLVEDLGGSLVVDVGYHPALFEADEVAAMVATYRAVLQRIESDLDCRLSAAALPAGGVEPVDGAWPTGEGVAEAASGAPEQAPGSVEKLLYGMWSEAFGGLSFSVHDDFFALGGYSLLAAELCVRINERLGVDLPLRAFFESPTVAELADRVRAAASGGAPQTAAITSGAERSLSEVLAEIERLSDDQVAAAIDGAVIDGAVIDGAVIDGAAVDPAVDTAGRASEGGTGWSR